MRIKRWLHHHGILDQHASKAVEQKTIMALKGLPDDLAGYLNLASVVRRSPNGRLWASYDADADVLCVHFN